MHCLVPPWPPQRIKKLSLKIHRRGESLFHPHIWVNGSLLKFIVDSGSQKNLISIEFLKKLGLKTTTHPQPYTIRWIHQGWYLCVSQQCFLPYSMNPFTNEVFCNVSPLEVSNVLLGQPYLWKRHDIYECKPLSMIITFANKYTWYQR